MHKNPHQKESLFDAFLLHKNANKKQEALQRSIHFYEMYNKNVHFFGAKVHQKSAFL